MVTLALVASLAVCHWTHHRVGDVTYYVQVCTVKRHVRRRPGRWEQAGPDNSVKPRIG